MSKTAMFPAVRAKPELKVAVEKTLDELQLSWSAFVQNAARQLVHEKKVVFEKRDKVGFTSAKSSELKRALNEAKASKGMTKSLNLRQAQKFLCSI